MRKFLAFSVITTGSALVAVKATDWDKVFPHRDTDVFGKITHNELKFSVSGRLANRMMNWKALEKQACFSSKEEIVEEVELLQRVSGRHEGEGKNLLDEDGNSIDDDRRYGRRYYNKEEIAEIIHQGNEKLFNAFALPPGNKSSEDGQPVHTILGRHLQSAELAQNLFFRRGMFNYLKSHPEIFSQPPVDQKNGLIVITGLHRTGSTLVQNLLASDPRAKSPETWTMVVPVADIEKLGKEECIKKLLKNEETVNKLFQSSYIAAIRKLHDYDYDRIEEDCMIAKHLFVTPVDLITLFHNDELTQWWQDNMHIHGRFTCQYIHAFLKIMNNIRGAPASHWVTKNPDHSNYLTSLLEEFPEANVIITHRDPLKVIPSWGKLTTIVGFFKLHSDCYESEDDIPAGIRTTRLWGLRILEHMQRASDNLVQELAALAETDPEKASRIYHVSFNRLMVDPMKEMERIYEHFGYELTEECRDSLQAYMRENQRYKHGKVVNTLEELDLKEEDVKSEMAKYFSTFKKFL